MKDKEFNRPDEGRQLDDLFRQGLTGYQPEPSRDLWKGISRRLWWEEISHFTFTNLSGLFWIGGVAGLIIIMAAFLVALVPKTASSDGPNPGSLRSDNLSLNSSNAGSPFTISSHNVTPAHNNHSNNMDPGMVTPGKARETHPVTPFISDEDQIFTEPSSAIPTKQASYLEPTNPAGGGGVDRSALSFLTSLSFDEIRYQREPDTLRFVTNGIILNVPKIQTTVPKFFSTGFGVSPEATFYKYESKHTDMNFSGNIDLAYHLGRFSIQTGIGLGYFADEGVYRVNYKSLDSVGFYEVVVGYTVSQTNPGQIIYTTQRIVVYDSLTHIADDRARNRYIYLQVPVFAGFRLLETRNIGLTIRTGPVVSFMISKKLAEPVFELSNARILHIINSTPVRTKTNWQFYLGLRMDYQVSKAFSFYAEPCYRYYFEPVIRPDEHNNENPYSLGLGIGIQYNFGKTNH